MKKPTVKAAVLVFVFLATLSLHQTVSALSSGQGFSLGNIQIVNKEDPIEKVEEGGQVLAESTDQPKQEVVAPEQSAEPQAPQEIIVEVKNGDSLDKIAKDNNTTYKRLFDANASIVSPDLIKPGDKLRIPKPEEVLASRELPAAPVAATPAPAKKSTPKPVASNAPTVASGSVWDQLAKCESGGNWATNTGNGYYGGLQFSPGTWRAVGGSGLPSQASREEQIMRGQILQARSGWGQWPGCASKLGLL